MLPAHCLSNQQIGDKARRWTLEYVRNQKENKQTPQSSITAMSPSSNGTINLAISVLGIYPADILIHERKLNYVQCYFLTALFP